MSIGRQPLLGEIRPASVAWWLRLLVVSVLLFQTGYVRYHLLTQAHQDVPSADIGDATVHHDDHDDSDHHDSDHHTPHAASDHLIQQISKHPSSLLPAYCLAAQTSIRVARPDAQVDRILAERLKIPGESPPDPLQPRAPPPV